MEKQNTSFYPMLFAVFGFMLIIASGFDFILENNTIPFSASLIGLILLIVAMALRKRDKNKLK
jgi:hypothetical protein